MLLSTFTAIVLPARSAGLVMPDDGSTATPKVSALHSTPSARTLNETVPLAWASKKDT